MSEPDFIPALIGFVAGAATALVCWFALRDTFRRPLFLRRNHRGVEVPVGVGAIFFFVAVAVWGVWRFIAFSCHWYGGELASLGSVATIAAGFGLLGLFDDLAGSGDDRGFRGHLGALVRGRLTTGGLKLLGGGLLALALTASPMSVPHWWRLLLGAAVIALAANTANLFDRAPARCIKLSLVCGVALFATCGVMDRSYLVGLALTLGAAVGLVFFDVREQLMLGDAGSNVLGAVLGWSLVVTTDWPTQVVVLVILVLVNVASERVSFSQVIDQTPILGPLDKLGRIDPDD